MGSPCRNRARGVGEHPSRTPCRVRAPPQALGWGMLSARTTRVPARGPKPFQVSGRLQARYSHALSQIAPSFRQKPWPASRESAHHLRCKSAPLDLWAWACSRHRPKPTASARMAATLCPEPLTVRPSACPGQCRECTESGGGDFSRSRAWTPSETESRSHS